MNCITNQASAIAQSPATAAKVRNAKGLPWEIARAERELSQTAGREQDKVLAELIGLYRKRAAAFDLGAA